MVASVIPAGDVMKKTIEVAKYTAAGAAYLVQALETLIDKYPALKESSAPLLRELKNMVALAEARNRGPNSEAWRGSQIPTRFERLQEGSASSALATLSEQLAKNVEVLVAYALNRATNEVMMGFGDNLSEEVKQALDNYFKSVLSEVGLIVDEHGDFVECDKNGKPVKDDQGNNKKADLNRVKDLIERVFTRLLSDKGYNVKAQETDYPQAKEAAPVAAEKAEAASETAKKEITAGKDETQEPEAQEPSAGAGTGGKQ